MKTKFRPKIDLTSKIINCWRVIKFTERTLLGKASFYYWNVECINCGINLIKETSHINKAKRCKHCCQMPKGHAGLHRLYMSYKSHCNKIDRIFALTIENFKQITKRNCYYCNAAPHQTMATNYNLPNKKSHWGDYTYNGIDRLDNSLGYVVDNCVPCCGICNLAKSSRGADEFKKYIKGICENAIAGTIPFLKEKNEKRMSLP